MFKFIKNTAEDMVGIEIYPIISFLIFFSFFVFVAWYVFKKDKKYIDKVSNLPLEEDKTELL
ncbi:MAG: CcoQ/FixQ family Cbb3-type cytochrome c oxidase assembly chaperone [Schleiferiaceae bacterium]|jgi:cbb3-type cytochrome oxidase subunit 3|nr:CcoQ/FixQ family Cbb3-type cytochrome c oxidase assembly chaperone [Schleiferiaceae bacterium]